MKADMVFNTAGRTPAVEELSLDVGKVDYSGKGISVDKFLRSESNPSVYACGDVSNHSLPLSPLAAFEASLVSQNIINGNSKEIETPLVPSVVFTIPNFATVGYSEKEAKKRFKNVTIKYEEAADWHNIKRINGSAYAYKILVDNRTDEIVGAHLVGPEAAEIINLFTLAMNSKIKCTAIKEMIFTYPSWSNDIKSMLA